MPYDSRIKTNKIYILFIAFHVIVMGVIKCGKVFAGIFILIENKQEKIKITAKTFSHA